MAGSNWYETLRKSMEWHSSPVDWCEPNYAVTSSVVEFYNSFSNIVYVIVPPLLMLLFHPYGKRVSHRVQIIWALMIFVGISSFYFHGTLTLSGQLLDEYGIIWMFTAGVAFYIPKNILPKSLDVNRGRFEVVMLFVTVLFTFMGALWPILNAFVQMCFSVPIVLVALNEVKKSTDKHAKFVAIHAASFWALGAVIWFTDRLACDLWLRAGIPGGHWLFHFVILYSSYRAIVFFVYRDAVAFHADARPRLAFWPSDSWRWLGLLYIEVDPELPLHGGQGGEGDGVGEGVGLGRGGVRRQGKKRA